MQRDLTGSHALPRASNLCGRNLELVCGHRSWVPWRQPRLPDRVRVRGADTGIHARGQDAVKSLYRMWADTDQSIFYVEAEEVAVADHFVCSVASVYQQLSGKSLRQAKILKHLPHHFSDALVEKVLSAKGWKAADDDLFLYKTKIEMVWPFDDQGRVSGEDVYEPDPDRAEVQKLERADVMTTQRAAKLLAPIIKPLPAFDQATMGVRS